MTSQRHTAGNSPATAAAAAHLPQFGISSEGGEGAVTTTAPTKTTTPTTAATDTDTETETDTATDTATTDTQLQSSKASSSNRPPVMSPPPPPRIPKPTTTTTATTTPCTARKNPDFRLDLARASVKVGVAVETSPMLAGADGGDATQPSTNTTTTSEKATVATAKVSTLKSTATAASTQRQLHADAKSMANSPVPVVVGKKPTTHAHVQWLTTTGNQQLQSPPASPSLPRPRPPGGENEDELKASMEKLQKSEWVSLEGLVQVALETLGKGEERCVRITELGIGSLNSVYQLDFSDGTSCAASIPNSPPSFFCINAKRSEIATMRYLKSSPLYNVPIPKVFGWNLTFDNPVGAPYILREAVPGINISKDGRFYALSAPNIIKVITELAKVQAELSKPSEFNKLGCIYEREGPNGEEETGDFYVGKMLSFPTGDEEEDAFREQYLGPFDSLQELWQARIERETLSAISNWSHLPSDSSIPSMLPPSKANPQQFGELLPLLSGLTTLFTPPKELSRLVIHHSDLAIRNVLFDPETLKITGVIDWEFASVMPLVVTGRFPDDLGWEGNEFARSLGKLGPTNQPNSSPPEIWDHHYYDWTSLNGVVPPPSPPSMTDYITYHHSPTTDSIDLFTNPTHTPTSTALEYLSTTSTTSSPPSPPLPAPPTASTPATELTTRASRLIKLFYYRKYYAARLAREDFALTRLMMDSVAYVKFNEVVMGGAEKWFMAQDWVREVYWRLMEVGEEKREVLRSGEGVVRIPEVVRKRGGRREVNLG